VDEVNFRRNLLELLEMGSSHLTLDEAVAGLDAASASLLPASGEEAGIGRSVWHLLEHMRITQEDIVRYTVDPSWRSPAWPASYWPSPEARADESRWRATLDGLRRDLDEVRGWVRDRGSRLTEEIPHGQGRTYLRQVLLVADHNAYHLGQIVLVRRALGLWTER
jgi:uncharacterized damage-inducible protein DinB